MEEKTISGRLLEVLACPACESRPRVRLVDATVCCTECGRRYPIENGVPIMLVDKAIGGGTEIR